MKCILVSSGESAATPLAYSRGRRPGGEPTADETEASLPPSAIERAKEVFEKLKLQDRAELVQARKAMTNYIFGQVAAGQTDKQRLVVAGLTQLTSIARMAEF